MRLDALVMASRTSPSCHCLDFVSSCRETTATVDPDETRKVPVTPPPILLQVLLRQRQWHRYGMFKAAYDKAARKIDNELSGTAPSRAQLHRWTAGELKRLPYTDHCRVLEGMFPGWSADQLFAPCPPEVLAGNAQNPPPREVNGVAPKASGEDLVSPAQLAGVSAVFATRAEFSYTMPPQALFDEAAEIRAAGLSLNLICQSYPDQRLSRLIKNGTRLHCLFLDPDGEAIKAREREEGYTDRHLTTLTKLNIELLSRLRARLPEEAKDRLTVAVYDETIRFNIVLIDDTTCVMQPYLPQARGVDSPTFLLEKGAEGSGLYDTFEQVFNELSERSRPV